MNIKVGNLIMNKGDRTSDQTGKPSYEKREEYFPHQTGKPDREKERKK